MRERLRMESERGKGWQRKREELRRGNAGEKKKKGFDATKHLQQAQ